MESHGFRRGKLEHGKDVCKHRFHAQAEVQSRLHEGLFHAHYAAGVIEFMEQRGELDRIPGDTGGIHGLGGRNDLAGKGGQVADELYECYKEQIHAQREAGADLIFCETMLSLAEARAAVIAANEEDIPVFVSFTVDEHGRTLTGAQLLPCLITLQAMGAAAVGLNCSGGPEEIAEFIEEAKPYADIPLIAKPNAGKPLNEAGTEYELSAERFAPYLYPLLKAGARYIGGCCGTTPVHIKLLKSALDKAVIPALPESEDVLAAASDTQAFFLSDHMEMSEPIECGYDLADDLINLEDERVNVARVRVSSAEDAEELARNAHMSHLPIAILPQNAECLERALRLYQGRAIIDSGCGLSPEELLPAAQKYGAIII